MNLSLHRRPAPRIYRAFSNFHTLLPVFIFSFTYKCSYFNNLLPLGQNYRGRGYPFQLSSVQRPQALLTGFGSFVTLRPSL